MSRFMNLLQKIGVVDKKTEEEEEGIPIFNSEQGMIYTAVPPETYFILPRVVLIPFPSPEQCGPISSYFNTQVSTKYMVWNLSEYPHPTQIFAGQSIDFIFVGYPNPPLSALFSIFNSIEKWLASDPNNFALLHCQATKGRSYMILACYLAWIQEIDTVMEGFTKICRITGVKAEMLPSQIRYMRYVQEIIYHSAPRTRKIRIQKIILDGIPEIETEGSAVRPYLQIFKGPDMIFNSISKDSPPVSYFPSDISICFDVNIEIEGDVLIRCRHLGRNNKPLTIFRMMFHTAFTKELVIRFNKADLDGPFNDDRFPEEFTADLFLADNVETEGSELQSVCMAHRGKKDNEEKKVGREKRERGERKEGEEQKENGESDEELDDYFKSLENK